MPQPTPAPSGTDRRPPATPLARAVAADLGVDLAAVTGSGRGGRILRADVEAVAAGRGEGSAASEGLVAGGVGVVGDGEVEEVRLSAMRRTVARRLVESMRSAPHFYLTVSVDAEALLAFREELNHQLPARDQDHHKVSLNDLIVKACAVLLAAHPELNVSFGGDRLLVHRRVHVGIAVAVAGGLVVPVVRDADHKTLRQLAGEAAELIGRARAGELAAEELAGGTFTVSNLGMFGVEQFTAVINPPQAAILAVGAVVAEPVATGQGVQVRRRMRLTLSIDHRALDGATGARFLHQLKTTLEHPLQIVA